MTWCITTCNFDIDVDLLFQENSTIGQKIALTEKIVSVLPKMKCPHRLEPHQIQGLDFIHIFPVIQWLVKRAIETREEMGDYVRAYSISQFQKTHTFPEDEEFKQRKQKAVSTVVEVSEVYAPQRRYRRQADAGELLDEESRVHSTLLEYGSEYYAVSPNIINALKLTPKIMKNLLWVPQAEEKKQLLAQGAQSVPPGMAEVSEEEDLQAAEELRIKTLMTGMAAMATEEGRLTASTVGQIVGLQSEEIKQIAFEYAEKAERSAEDRPERYGPVQQHRRMVASLNKQIQQRTKELEEVRPALSLHLFKQDQYADRLERELSSLADVEAQADSGLLEKLRALVAMNENLKQQEQEFRTHCREEMTRLQQSIEDLKIEFGDEADDQKVLKSLPLLHILHTWCSTVHNERSQLIDQQYNTDREKLQKIRLLMARRNREIAILQRKIDEVPSRAELTQYQKRFIELYSQVSATHKETKQFFTLYNTLDDKKVYLEKEYILLKLRLMFCFCVYINRAMASSGAKEQFLRQMEQIVEGIKQNRIKMEKKKQENKMRRDQLNDDYLELLDKQRLYFKTVKDFKEVRILDSRILMSKVSAVFSQKILQHLITPHSLPQRLSSFVSLSI
uniref:Coiled-coil domain-containing protein 93 n=1 Tax=Astyanax mexicanus TaxID=7994 RepID=A0A8B9KLJ6_ASTMX